MRVIDLTHTINETMPVYPGTEPPKLIPANSYEENGFKETLLQFYSHTGTHVDPPAHLFAGRTTLDQFPIEQFTGKALVIDCRGLREGEDISMDFADGGNDQSDNPALLGKKAARIDVRLIVKLLRTAEDQGSRRFGHLHSSHPVVEHARHRAGRNSGFFCHIAYVAAFFHMKKLFLRVISFIIIQQHVVVKIRNIKFSLNFRKKLLSPFCTSCSAPLPVIFLSREQNRTFRRAAEACGETPCTE